MVPRGAGLNLLLPGPPLTVNRAYQLHSRSRAKQVKYWRDLAGELGGERIREWRKVNGREPVPCEIIATPVTPKVCRQDTGAVMPTVKAIVDGLVDAGYWPDDTPNWIRKIELWPQLRMRELDEPGIKLWLKRCLI